MLVPAILYKHEIEQKMKSYYYSTDMMLVSGGLNNWLPNILEEPDGNTYQYAILDVSNKLIGFLTYHINWYNSCASQFGIISFDRGHQTIGRDLFKEMNKLINEYKLHRIEWCMVSGNPVERHYDKFCKLNGGTKHILNDVFKDREGNYHNNIIYEIVRKNQ